MNRKFLYFAIVTMIALIVGVTSGIALRAGGKNADSRAKISVASTAPDESGKQLVTVTLDVKKGWHMYANPVDNEDLRGAQTVVKILGAKDTNVLYPPGLPQSNNTFGSHKVYEGRTNIKVVVVRPAGDNRPLEVEVKGQVCDDDNCFPVLEKFMLK